ncbi:hypothetical protein PTI45_03976 [Paenibacillus nuruki]|uniref:Uncharacterized protein n=1 Tax=Paenibacillus nuruki TaxID=1886670 RepID=A0A1E3KYN7_9BACL|nr:hypothetical protein [Paenibacillus nuruki]ODP26658.1 hypothetical protein PTI45_03976 [Paenibacillus nuruki]
MLLKLIVFFLLITSGVVGLGYLCFFLYKCYRDQKREELHQNLLKTEEKLATYTWFEANLHLFIKNNSSFEVILNMVHDDHYNYIDRLDLKHAEMWNSFLNGKLQSKYILKELATEKENIKANYTQMIHKVNRGWY